MKLQKNFFQESSTDWTEQERQAIVDPKALAKCLPLSIQEIEDIEKACGMFQMKITPYYLGLIDSENPNCPIKKMSIPSIKELDIHPSELNDPIGDVNNKLNNQPVKSLTHRYGDRVLLYPTSLCGIYCRHCFRRRLAGKSEHSPSRSDLDKAMDYIEAHKEVREVILTGGDPLMMSDKKLVDILNRLRAIDHVKMIRIHSRMPVVNPYRLTDALVAKLKEYQPLILVTHFNHPVEITETAKRHIAKLVDNGITVLNQGVCLKGINNNVEVLRELGWKLIEARIMPYYLHHLDRAKGISHFRISLEEGIKLIKDLRGTMPGYSIPTYLLDIPEGYGKVPLQYHYIGTDEQNRMYVESPDGDYRLYADTDKKNPRLPSEMPSLKPLNIYPIKSKLEKSLRKVMETHDG